VVLEVIKALMQCAVFQGPEGPPGVKGDTGDAGAPGETGPTVSTPTVGNNIKRYAG